MADDYREIRLHGIRYVAHSRGPALWNTRPRRWWEFWRGTEDVLQSIDGELIEFTGHPVPLRSRIRTAIPLGTLHSIPTEELLDKLERALRAAERPHGHDLVAVTRGEDRFVVSWGDWNVLVLLLTTADYQMESEHYGPDISSTDAAALYQVIADLQARGGRAVAEWLPSELPDGFTEFLRGGAFHLTDLH